MSSDLNPLATALLEQGLKAIQQGDLKSLFLAAKKFKMAAGLAPDRFLVWEAWGDVLFLLGEKSQESRFFMEAEEKLKKAIELCGGCQNLITWKYALVFARIAHYSGEVVDWQKALSLFQKVSGEMPSEFWIEYGKAHLKLAKLLNDFAFTQKGVECIQKAAALSSSCETWHLLAEALEELFVQTHEHDHFHQAHETFAHAFQLSSQDVDLLHAWARLLLEAGRLLQDSSQWRLCIEKCQQGYLLNVKHAELIATWAEALAALGEDLDQIDLLYEAQNKITEALHLDEDNLEVLHAEAQVLYSFAIYYDHFDAYFQAIEKFQEVVAIDRTRHQDWSAMAKTYCWVAGLDSDIDAAEKAVRFYAKAIELKPLCTYYFEYSYALSRLGEMKKDPALIKQAISYFEYTLQMQKNALYLHSDWLYHYAISLDFLGDYEEEETHYYKALETLMQVLLSEPDFPNIHYRIGLTYCHLGEITSEITAFQGAIHHFRLAHKHEPDHDFVMLDWGIALIHLAEHSTHNYQEAERKLLQAARLGNQNAFYQLGSLYSLIGQCDKALDYLHKSHEAKLLPPLDELLEDEWLENLRSTPAFQAFLQHRPSKK